MISTCVLEDHDEITIFYNDLLINEGHRIIHARSIQDLKSVLKNHSFDILIADNKLKDGEFLDYVKTENSQLMRRTPTIIVSSYLTLNSIEECFEYGAADFIIKPFRADELIAKARRITYSLPVDSLFLDRLTLTERKIFEYLYSRRSQYITRKDIVENVWRSGEVGQKNLNVHLMKIRRKINDCNGKWDIKFRANEGWGLFSLE